MSLTDQNTEEVLTVTKESLIYLYKLLERLKYKHLEEKAKKNMEILEKRNPNKIKVADISKDDINKFLEKADEKNIKCFIIKDVENSELSNLQYSIDDEYKIVEAFKEIQIEKEIEKEFEKVDFDELKKDLENATDKKVDLESYNKAVNDILGKDEGKIERKTLEEIEKEIRPIYEKEKAKREEKDRSKNKNKDHDK